MQRSGNLCKRMSRDLFPTVPPNCSRESSTLNKASRSRIANLNNVTMNSAKRLFARAAHNGSCLIASSTVSPGGDGRAKVAATRCTFYPSPSSKPHVVIRFLGQQPLPIIDERCDCVRSPASFLRRIARCWYYLPP